MISVLSTQNSGDLLYYTFILTLEMMKTIESSTELRELMSREAAPSVFNEVDVPEGGEVPEMVLILMKTTKEAAKKETKKTLKETKVQI